MRPRLIEPPLGSGADERPTREAALAMWAEARKQPVPDYDGETLGAFLRTRAGAPRPL